MYSKISTIYHINITKIANINKTGRDNWGRAPNGARDKKTRRGRVRVQDTGN